MTSTAPAHAIHAVQGPSLQSSAYSSTESIGRRIQRTPLAVAKRLFPSAVSSPSAFCSRRTSSRPPASPPMPVGTERLIGGGNSGIPSHHARNSSAPVRPTPAILTSVPSQNFEGRHGNGLRDVNGDIAPLTSEKPQASTSGGAVTMTIQLAEPMLFLQGFDQSDHSNRTPAMLRGSLLLRISKPTKIKTVSLAFRGRARTEWPEGIATLIPGFKKLSNQLLSYTLGIPPKKSEYFEEKEIMQHIWPFFNAQFATAELGHGADSCRLYKSSSDSTSSITSAIVYLARSASPIGISPALGGCSTDRRLSLQLAQSRSFSKGESPNGVSVAQRGYRIFQPGDYVYNFELPIESCLPETIDVDLGTVKYELEGTIERPGAFRPNLVGKRDVILIRCPAETSLECSEPIAISRTWEDQLHYDIVISGKSFPLGSAIPIAFKLTPLAKVRCHRIKIFITENIGYSCRNKKIHRLDPTRKVQLFEKRADGPPTSAFAGSSARILAGGGFSGEQVAGGIGLDGSNGSDSLLGDLTGQDNIGPTEMELAVQLPGCNVKEKDRIHFDTTYQNIQVHHWIKIVMRLSKADPNDPGKRRHFEISIDSPLHILSCRAAGANTALPAYNSPNPGIASSGTQCSCPPLTRRNSPRDGPPTLNVDTQVGHLSSGQPEPPNEVARPLHLIRYPSHNPPPFDYDVAPPPLITPPPRYESVVLGEEGLADYFQRLADETAGDDDTDDELVNGDHGRLMPPLTPGGRNARSMDERRRWEPLGISNRAQ
ncbi:unnamed protein product [Tuber aestivum]|uniref:Arrestin C-terminal-like domain-containing protein n=1 Tax=Tuber aestivum TaxID=59557 RepID=A0A292PJS7_9PEZI|nr:unnamed protein product [Tuber aestivum]